jgi:putative cardiolipin synthase
MRRRNMRTARRALERSATRAAARPYLLRLAESSGVRDMLAGRFRMSWTDAARILCDPPEKAQGQERERWMIRTIAPTLASAAHELRVMSPYFVLRDEGVRLFGDIVGRGVAVSVLTNSLAATDVAAVHAGYAPHRRGLLALGVRLFELKPHGQRHRMRLLGSSSASLHTKAFTIDGTAGFVGSFNFDPRSVSLNTELGVLLHDADIVRELDAIFIEQTGADSSWRVWLDGGAVRWSDDEDAPPTVWTREPAASFPRRLVSLVLRQLPIDDLL